MDYFSFGSFHQHHESEISGVPETYYVFTGAYWYVVYSSDYFSYGAVKCSTLLNFLCIGVFIKD